MNAVASFATTHWSTVLAAGDSAAPGSREALEKLCRIYWFPLYAFARRSGHSEPQGVPSGAVGNVVLVRRRRGRQQARSGPQRVAVDGVRVAADSPGEPQGKPGGDEWLVQCDKSRGSEGRGRLDVENHRATRRPNTRASSRRCNRSSCRLPADRDDGRLLLAGLLAR